MLKLSKEKQGCLLRVSTDWGSNLESEDLIGYD